MYFEIVHRPPDIADRKVKVFLSYSHDDEGLRARLDKHLSPLKREKIIESWCDRELIPGTELDQEIRRQLETADIILLLVSSAFITSDYCYCREMQGAMKRHEAGTARVIPVILKPVLWHTSPFGKLAALPTDGKAVTLWKNRDQAFTNVAEGIRKAVLDPDPTHPSPTQDSAEEAAVLPAELLPLEYEAHVVQTGGIGSHVTTKIAYLVHEHAYLKPVHSWVTTSFNGPGDVMWVHCRSGYRISSVHSSSGNSVHPGPGGVEDLCGISIEDKLKNSITLRCARVEGPEEAEFQRATGTLCPECGAPMGPFQDRCNACDFRWSSRSDPLSSLTGHYVREGEAESAEISVVYLGNREVRVNGLALWGKTREHGPNIGQLQFDGKVDTGRNVRHRETHEQDVYEIALSFSDGGLLANEHGTFTPFGMNVSFAGAYVKI